MPAFLLSAAGVVPGDRVSQLRTLELAQRQNDPSPRRKKYLRTIYEKMEIDERYSVLSEAPGGGRVSFGEFFQGDGPGTEKRMLQFEKHAPALAFRVSQGAMAASGVSGRDIGHLVSVSCTGFNAPGFDISVLMDLGLSPKVSRTHVGFMGCHGAFNALRVASALSQDKPGQDALVVSVELCSLHYRHGFGSKDALGNALFSDGAAAAVVSSRPRGSTSWRIASQGSFIIPDSQDAIAWRIGDRGFRMGLSSKIRSLIQKQLRTWLEPWLADENLRLEDIRSWAVHPGGPGVLDAVESGLGLSRQALSHSREVLRTFGNMSSATILFILERLRRLEVPIPCVALGFGPGLAIEAMLFS